MVAYTPEIDSDLDGLILATVRQAQRISRGDLLRQTGLSRTVLGGPPRAATSARAVGRERERYVDRRPAPAARHLP